MVHRSEVQPTLPRTSTAAEPTYDYPAAVGGFTLRLRANQRAGTPGSGTWRCDDVGADSRKRQRADLSLLSDMWLHCLLGEHGLSGIRQRCHRQLRRSKFPRTKHGGVGGVTPPLGLLAARYAAKARGEAGVTKRPTVFCQVLICFVTAGAVLVPRGVDQVEPWPMRCGLIPWWWKATAREAPSASVLYIRFQPSNRPRFRSWLSNARIAQCEVAKNSV